jgi:hypothetical protein
MSVKLPFAGAAANVEFCSWQAFMRPQWLVKSAAAGGASVRIPCADLSERGLERDNRKARGRAGDPDMVRAR